MIEKPQQGVGEQIKEFFKGKYAAQAFVLDLFRQELQAQRTKMDKHISGLIKENTDLEGKLYDLRTDFVEKLEKRKEKLYCTADELGYHDKNCKGLPCEKAVLSDLIQEYEDTK